MVTHDLASPLTAILGHAQVLRRKLPAADPAQGQALVIEQSARQMRRLVSDLHGAAAIGAGRFTVAPREADLVAVLEQVVAQQRASAPDRHMPITAPERLDGVWDAQRLGPLATNLLSNAIKYSPPGSEVRVVIDVEDEVVHLSVIDEGPGMLPEQQRDLFRPFSRLARDRSIQGTGLGLYIADTIAQAHGGQITLESAPGHGSTFTVTLPRYPKPARAMDAPEVAPPTSEGRSDV
jgi:signal transduction histidine kinase